MSAATADKVVRQIEFYFSDSNLPRDRFMLERVHESPEGYVDIGLIATFARMRDILKVRSRRIGGGGCGCDIARLQRLRRWFGGARRLLRVGATLSVAKRPPARRHLRTRATLTLRRLLCRCTRRELRLRR